MNQEDNQTAELALAWKVLYGEDFEGVPDPNKPWEAATWKARKRARIKALESFMAGPGKPVIDEWIRKLKGQNLYLLFGVNTHDCACPACTLIQQIRFLISTMKDLEKTIQQKKEE